MSGRSPPGLRPGGSRRPARAHVHAWVFLLAGLHGLQAPSIKFEQVLGVLFRLGGGASLETDSRSADSAITGGHGYEFHKVKRNVLVAARAGGNSGCFVHERLP